MKTTLLTLTTSLIMVYIVTSTILVSNVAYSQNDNDVVCGEVVKGEFAQNAEEKIYTIQMQPGDKLTVSFSSPGESLRAYLALYGPSNLLVAESSEGTDFVGTRLVSKSPKFSSGTLAARGSYKIYLLNSAVYWHRNYS